MIQADIAVIGGGAAGLMAAVTAAKAGAVTVIIEHMDRVGKKILATGNGKCNYTNALQSVTCYRGENPAFVLPVLEQFDLKATLVFFQEIGIYPKCRNGYYYPASEQAASVLDVLRLETEYWNIRTELSQELTSIKKQGEGFFITTNKMHRQAGTLVMNKDSFLVKRIIFATGLYASPKTGSDGSAISFIEQFGHTFVNIVPALVQLKGKQSFFKTLAGIRAEATVSLYINQVQIASEKGELQLTDYGISGIPVFQLSRFATKALLEKKSVMAKIDFIPGFSDQELLELLKLRFYNCAHGKCAAESLIGLFNKKLIDVLLKEAGIPLYIAAEQITEKQLQKLNTLIKQFPADISGSKNFEQAQVCAGGINTSEIVNDTLESRLTKGIYFAGEVIDIDGICGGYNLQWAWSSGYVAGIHAAAHLNRNILQR